jgi:hypothetical protein
MEDLKAYNRAWYADHPEYRERQTKLKRERRELRRKQVQEVKAVAGCEDCGEKDHVVLQFHHEHSKEFNVSDSKLLSRSWDRILHEIKKCVVLCANCHLRRHYSGI